MTRIPWFLNCFLFCYVSSYLSIDDLQDLIDDAGNLTKSYEKLRDIKEDMMKIKFLEFNETKTLFVAYSNRIVKINFTESDGNYTVDTVVKSEPYVFEAPPYPSTYYYVQDRYQISFDTCLSRFDRNNQIMRSNPYIRATESYNTSYEKAGDYPSNQRPEQSWVRFNDKFERHHCHFKINIRGMEKIQYADGKYALWLCGSFSTFPKSFLVDPYTLKVISIKPNASKFFDTNHMTCARWLDETMVTASINNNTEIYIGSGWGLYRPSRRNPDVPYNNSTMLFSDWKMLFAGYYWPTRMAMVLGRDVRFIDQYYETEHYLYFFGHEVNPQYSYINALTRQSYRSFMIRICKNDTGYKYTAADEFQYMDERRSLMKDTLSYWATNHFFKSAADATSSSYTSSSWGDAHHFPTKHFTSVIKFPFGCYLKRFEGAQSYNYFWGEQNMMYFNRLAGVDLSFNWTAETAYEKLRKDPEQDYYNYEYFWFEKFQFDEFPNLHLYNGMVAAFSSEGFSTTHFHNGWNAGSGRSRPSGAICQFQVSEWKTDHLLYEREPRFPDSNRFNYTHNGTLTTWDKYFPKNQRQYGDIDDFRKHVGTVAPSNLSRIQEFYALYGTLMSDFYKKGTRWFQGLQPTNFFGLDFMAVPTPNNETLEYLTNATKCGKCRTSEELETMTKKDFEALMNHSSMAWPTDWMSYLTKYYDTFFHLNPMAVAGDNASFYLEGVEFQKMFTLERNFTNYLDGNVSRPLLYLTLVSTDGDVYRVVMCDLVSYPINISTCEMRNTDQPYVIYKPMTVRRNQPIVLEGRMLRPPNPDLVRRARVSSLLSKWRFSTEEDHLNYHNRLDPQFLILKDIQYDKELKKVFLQFTRRLVSFSLLPKNICPKYKTCIDCASDPFCVWIDQGRYIGHGRCIVYEKNMKNDSYMIQDVLGRGEKCYPQLNKRYSSSWCNYMMNSGLDESVFLQCNASTLFRGRVFWRSRADPEAEIKEEYHNEESGQSDNTNYAFGPDNSLVLFSSETHPRVNLYECVGIPYDGGHEKILASQTVVSIDEEERSKVLKKITQSSYCPCVKTLTEQLPKNDKVKEMWETYCPGGG